MARRLSEPFRPQTWDKILQFIVNIVRKGESGSILNLARRDQLYRIKQIQNHYPEIRNKLNRHFNFVFLDVSFELIEDVEDLSSWIKTAKINNEQPTILFIVDADILIHERMNILSVLDTLSKQYQHLSIIYLFQKNILLPLPINKFSTLYQNVFIFPLFEKEDCIYFFKQLKERFKANYSDKLIHRIVNQCGGSFWLIKQAARYYADTKDDRAIFTNAGIKLRLQTLYEELSKQERKILIKVINKNFGFDNSEQPVVDYFLQTRLLRKSKNKFEISIPILKKFIEDKITSNNAFSLNSQNQFVLNGVVLDTFFSQKEKRILLYLFRQKSIVSREALAHIVWQSNPSYTDWALDQSVKRLRDKLKKLGLHNQIIKTIKNQGYILI